MKEEEIKIRYVMEEKGSVVLLPFSLEEIEEGRIPIILKGIKNLKIKDRNLFTGIKDKRGIDAYEGDIIEDKEINKRYVIRFGNFYFSKEWYCGYASTYSKHTTTIFGVGFYLENVRTREIEQFDASMIKERFEIIGNIYENPELLEEGEK